MLLIANRLLINNNSYNRISNNIFNTINNNYSIMNNNTNTNTTNITNTNNSNNNSNNNNNNTELTESYISAQAKLNSTQSKFLYNGFKFNYPTTATAAAADNNSSNTDNSSYYDSNSWPNDPLLLFNNWYKDAENNYNQHQPQQQSTTNTESIATESVSAASAAAAIHWPNTIQLATINNTTTGFPSVRNVLLKGIDNRGLIFFTNYNGSKGRSLLTNPHCAIVHYCKSLERQIRIEGTVELLTAAENNAYFHSRPLGSQISAAVSPQSSVIINRVQLEQHYVHQVSRVSMGLIEKAAKSTQSAAVLVNKAALLTSRELPAELLLHSNNGKSVLNSTGQVTVIPLDPNTESIEISASTAHSLHQHALTVLSIFQSDPELSPLTDGIIERPANWGGFRIIPTVCEYWQDGQYRLHSRIRYTAIDSSNSSNNNQAAATTTRQWKREFLAP